MRGAFAGLILAACLLSGCSAEGGLPRPPGLLGVPRGETTEKSGATVTVLRCESTETPAKVGEFYQTQLGTKPGWKGTYRKGAEMATWNDGNVVQTDVDSFKPKDPSKPGSMVALYPGRDSGSLVYLVSCTPKRK